MYQIIYMKADYEPWWKFEGWETHIVSRRDFQSETEFKKSLQQTLADFRHKYEYEEKKDHYYAFWTDKERVYCEACEDDMQVYHGLIVGKVQER